MSSMWRGEFTLDSKPFEVRLGSWGTEEYLLDGKLLERRRSWARVSRRQFRIGEHDVLIEIGIKDNATPMGRAFLDGKLHAEDLFRHEEQEFLRPKVWRVALALCFVLGMVAIAKYVKG